MWKSSVELNETEQRQENHLNIKNKMLAINRSYQNTTKIENDKILEVNKNMMKFNLKSKDLNLTE